MGHGADSRRGDGWKGSDETGHTVAHRDTSVDNLAPRAALFQPEGASQAIPDGGDSCAGASQLAQRVKQQRSSGSSSTAARVAAVAMALRSDWAPVQKTSARPVRQSGRHAPPPRAGARRARAHTHAKAYARGASTRAPRPRAHATHSTAMGGAHRPAVSAIDTPPCARSASIAWMSRRYEWRDDKGMEIRRTCTRRPEGKAERRR